MVVVATVEVAVVEEVVAAETVVAVKTTKTKIKINPTKTSKASLGELGQEVQDIRTFQMEMVSAICTSAGDEEPFSVLIRDHVHGKTCLHLNNETVTSSAVLTLIY